MSIASELNNLEGNIEDSYDAVNDMGGIIPAQRNMDNLDQAIRTIPQNTGTTYTAGYGIDIDQNDEISVDTTVIAEKTDIPTATSDLTNDSGFITSADLPTKTSDLTNDGSDGNSTYVEADDLATVATSGSYNDLSNTPTIPAAQVNSDWDAASGVAQILNKPTLATVATSGSYTDLSDKPTIPTVNDATLTITQNGTSAGTFTANASSNATIALTDTTYSAFTGATSSVAGSAGLVPAPTTSDPDKFLKGDGTWATVQSGAEVKKFYIDNDYIFRNGTVNQEILDAPGGNAVSEATLFAAMKDGLAMIIANWNGTDYESAIATNAWMDSGVLKFTIYGSSSVDSSIDVMQVVSTGGGYYDFDGYDIVPKNGTLTIQHNGTNVQTFSANQGTNATANIETIWADDIAPATQVPPITSSMIDWSTMTSSSVSAADFVTAATGYTISNTGMKKMGNILIGSIVIKKDSGYFGEGQVIVGAIKPGYVPNMTVNSFAGLGDSEWSIKTACYFYVNNGGTIYINNQTGVQNCNYVKASVVWFTA